MPPSMVVNSLTPNTQPPEHENGNGAAERYTQTQQRNRIQLSCTHCRHAKLKCDRQNPCSQCIKKGRASLCTYPAPAKRKKPSVSMHNRLKHLESLVKGVMAGQSPDGPNDTEVQGSMPIANELRHRNSAEVAASFDKTAFDPSYTNLSLSNSSGQVLLGLNETTYVGATHWAAILSDIEEVKSYFNEVDLDDLPQDECVRPDTSLIFNSLSAATKEDMLAALPERPIVDRLIYRYFNSSSPALHIIHKPTFQKEYRKFWADQMGTPISWLGLLYSLMCLATFAAHGAGEENLDTRGTAMEMIRAYRGCCAQCLVLSKYAQPGPYTLETFIIYMEGEFVLSRDDQMNCYLVVGVAVRLALRMGLHRDSDNVAGNISAFQGEMRRRLWHLIVQLDLLVSFHIGLPAMVQSIQSDTRFPRNLRDQDFDDDIIELPVSRPQSEVTGMSYTIAKSRLCQEFSKVAEQANRLSLPPYDEIMNVDMLLDQAFAQVPPHFRMIPVDLSITDSPQDLIQRFSLTILFHKTRCVLHRKYFIKGKENEEYSYSRTKALDASMELLSIQSQIHDAVQPGGPLAKDLWFVFSLSMHDFLLAAMIAYVSLIQAVESSEPVIFSRQQEEVVKVLEGSFRIWAEMRSISADARRAYEVLNGMVKRINSSLSPDNAEDVGFPLTTGAGHARGFNGVDFMSGLSLNDYLPSTVMPTNLMKSLGTGQVSQSDNTMSPSSLGMHFDLDSMPIEMDSLGAMIDVPTSLDWDVFDNQIRPQRLTEETWPELSFEDFEFGNNHNHNL